MMSSSSKKQQILATNYHTTTNLLDLPYHILLQIFNMVIFPIKTIARCRTLCKDFNALFSDPSFLQAQAMYPRLITYGKDGFCLIERAAKGEDKFVSTKLDLGYEKDFRVMSSCRGSLLVHLNPESSYSSLYHTKLCVVNPLTREFISLPAARKMSRAYYQYGMGFSSKYNQYKVVIFDYDYKITYSPNGTSVKETYHFLWDAKVLTLGNNAWREVEFVGVNKVDYIWHLDGPVMVNGFLHWSTGRGIILRFDLESEKFDLVPIPFAGLSGDIFVSTIGVVTGSLYVGACPNQPHHDKVVGIWVLRTYGDWNSWKKFMVIPSFALENLVLRRFRLLGLMENSEILIVVTNPLQLFCFDPRTSESRLLSRVCGVNRKMKGAVYCDPSYMSIIRV